MTTPVRRALGAAAAVLALLGAAACTGSTSGADVASTASPRPSATASSPGSPSPSDTASATAAPARTPKVGDCYDLSYTAATKAVSDAAPVACGQSHTATTAYVGTIDPYEDGHQLAVDSDRVQQRIAEACPAKVDAYVGGDREQRRLSRVRAIWFSPTLAQAENGATWYRCDVVAVRSEDALATLPRRLAGALGTKRGDDLATCGTAAPDKASFERVTCGQKHAWQAISSVELPRSASYLGKAAGAAADSTCKDAAADRADDPLRYTWSFQWPSREDFDTGQRYGLCWIPS